jgi:Ca2+-binding RTX toxin-like protein
MATFTTNVTDFSTLFNVVIAGESAPDFPTFAPLADGFNFFGDSTRTPAGAIGDSLQTVFHRTGVVGEGMGGFTAVAGAGGLDDSNWMVNGLVVVYDEGQTTLVLRSTAGITINPIESDLDFTGTINGGAYRHDSAFLHEEFDFSGTINVATGAVAATEIRFFSNEQVGETEFFTVEGWVTGTINGTIDDEEGFVVTGGLVKSIMLNVNGESFEVAGLAGFDAKKIFTSDDTLMDTAEEFEALFSQILSGADVITGQTGGQTLKGFAGNDTLIAGGSSTTFFGGKGDDTYDFNGYYGPDHTISGETDTVNGGGVDTVKSYDSYTLGEGLEKLVLIASNSDEGLSGYGNTSNNTITGTEWNDQLNGNGGADSLFGGLGGDDYYLDNIGDKVGIEAVARRGMFDDDYDEVYSLVTHTLLANYEALYLQGEGNVNGTGNVLDNEIDGSSGNNSLAGLGGDDGIDGYGGNDTMAGGDGDDDLYGGDGNDRVDGGNGDDYLQGDADDDVVLGLAGEDYLSGGSGNDSMDGGADDDYLNGESGNDTMLGGLGMDEIYAGSDNDSIDGGAGDDRLFGDDQNDTVLGGAGVDWVIGSSGNDSLSGGDGNDSISGGDGMDTMDGGAGDDSMDGGFDGGEANDIMSGGAGNDTLLGDAGSDNLSGGDGNDYINTGNNSFSNTVSGGGGNDWIEAYTDTDSIDGGAGIDSITMNVVEGATVTLSATTENLAFVGGFGSSVTGNALGNVLTSGTGGDMLIGGLGNDTYNIQSGDTVQDTTLAGGGTADLVQISGEGVAFTLGDGIENLTVFGSEANIDGNSLANVLRSEEGSANLDGAGGNDTYHVQSDDSVGESSPTGGGNDLVIATLGDGQGFFNFGEDLERLTLLHDGEGTITAYGNNLGNLITGAITAGANNAIHGGDGNDTILGGIGNDTLNGGDASMTGGEHGNDSLSGGAGDDTYVFSVQDRFENINNFAGLTTDKITDAGGNDTLLITGVVSEGFTLTLATLPTGIENFDGSGVTGNVTFNIGGATGLAGNNLLIGGNDSITGDTLNGGAGNDTLDGGGGNADVLIGGAGNDYYVLGDDAGGTPTEALTGGTLDILELSVLAVEGVLNVGDYANFEGLVINDNSMDGSGEVYGTSGANYLGSKGVSVHTLGGGMGNDTYAVHVLDSLTGGDQIVGENDSSGGGTDLVVATLDHLETWSLGEGLENLTLLHDGEGTVIGNGNGVANVIIGAMTPNAHNSINSGGGNDTITTGGGNDYIYGDAGNDSVNAGAGDDTIISIGGADTVNGGLGNDSYTAGFKDGVVGAATAASLRATITDAGGTDSLTVNGNESVTSFTYAMTAIDNLDVGGFGPMTAAKITGSATANNIVTGWGNDSVAGGGGNDYIYSGYGSDTVLGGDGEDSLHGGQAGSDSLDGGNGNDIYTDGGNDSAEGDVQTYVMAQAGDQIQEDEGSGGVDTLLFKVITNQFSDGDAATIYLGEHGFIENAVWQGTGSVDMIGNGRDNMLTAGAGNDYLDGGEGGNDTLVGGAGNDELYGGDNVQMGDFVYADGDDSLDGGAGNDELDGGEGGSDTLVGGLGDDDMYGGDRGRGAIYDVENDEWDDIIYADGGDSMDGGAGNDYLDGGEGGDDSLIGGVGDDELWGGEGGSDSLVGGDGNDALYGGEGLDMFEAGGGYQGDGNNSLDGGNGNDYLYGGEGGDDTLIGGAGDDIMDGGGMTMTAAQPPEPESPEDPPIDPIAVFAADGDDSMDGGAGNDSMFGGEGGSDTMLGGLGNDTMDGGISAAAGSMDTEIVEVLDGDDEMDGGAGNDSMYGGEGGYDSMIGGDGNDTLDGADGDDDLMGDAGNDALYGGEGFDEIAGGAGNDTLYGGSVGDEDFDMLDGGAGNDVYHGRFDDNIGEGEDGGGIDRVFLSGGSEEDYFILNEGIEHATVEGEGSLYGNSSANALVAGDGDGFVYGGGGNDTLTGGDGADQFVLRGVGDGDLVTITDYSKLDGDSIALYGEDFVSILGDGIAPSEITNAATAVGTGEQFVYKFSTGELFYDADGTGVGAQVLVAKFTGNKPISLTSDDISGWVSPPT